MDNSSRVADELHLALLFTGARTHNGWADRPVEERLLRRLYELARMPPTAANTQPMRLLFVRSGDAKERLRPMLHEANREKTMKAPATAIVAYDTEFYEKMPVLFPARPEWRDTFAGMPEERREKMATHSALLRPDISSWRPARSGSIAARWAASTPGR